MHSTLAQPLHWDEQVELPLQGILAFIPQYLFNNLVNKYLVNKDCNVTLTLVFFQSRDADEFLCT